MITFPLKILANQTPRGYHSTIKQKTLDKALLASGSWSIASGLRGPDPNDEWY